MKWLLRSTPLFALLCAACSTSNTPIADSDPSNAPTIASFSPDTVWTLRTLTIHGTHFGYGNDAYVAIDTAEAQLLSAHDTIMTVSVPETAQTGPIHVATMNGRATLAKPVVVEATFNPHTINDSLSVGASFSIPGTGLNHYRGQLLLIDSTWFWYPVVYPIDSVFANRIVSHVSSNGLSGSIYLYDSGGVSNLGTLTVTHPSSWKTLSIILDQLTVTETHTRTGYIHGPAHLVDSNWMTTATYSRQQDVNVSEVPFVRTRPGELQFSIADPFVQIRWDTVDQIAMVSYQQSSYSATATHTIDTEWYSTSYGGSETSVPALLPVTNAIEFTLPSFSYQITEDSTDTQGLVNWVETTKTTVNSGSFDLILKP